jgi:HK97 family phage major capsid protein
MSKLKALVEKRNLLNSQAKELLDAVETEVRSISTEEKEKFDALTEEVRGLDATIELLKQEATEDTVVVENENENRGESPMNKELEVRGLEQYIRRQDGEEVRALVTTSQGNVIPTHLHDEIIELLTEVAPLFSKIPKLTPVSGNLEILAETGIGTAGWVGEFSDVATSDFTTRKVKLEQRRAGSAIELSQQLINDSGIDIVAYAKEKLYQRLGFALDRAVISGTIATDSFEGLVNSPVESKVLTAAVGAVAIDDLMDTLNALHPTLQAGAVWIFSRPLFNTLAKVKDANGHYYLTRDVIEGKPVYRLFGIEILISDVVEAPATGKKAAYLVNFSRAYAGMVKKDVELKQINADTKNALRGSHTLVLDVYADAKIVDPQAIRFLEVK